jgi:NADH-quinone oxidoreductase subunit F
MDLRLHPTPATAQEQAAVDALLGAPAPERAAGPGHAVGGGQAAREQRHLLLPALWAVQTRIGWISPAALSYICERLTIPPAEAYGVASFYALLTLSPQPPVVLHICEDLVCMVNGADDIRAELERRLGLAGMPTADGRATWHPSPCLGLCERPPAALCIAAGEQPQEEVFAPTTAADLVNCLHEILPAKPPPQLIPQAGDANLRLLGRVGRVDPTNLDAYRAHGGYAALRRAIEMGPEAIIRELNDAKLLGRGGAAFPTGRKWEAVARTPVRPHYLVCNADESEPGTFKDRLLMEEDPFALLEAMTIAAFATGCDQGYLYIRGEYPLAARRLTHAIVQARARGLLGADVMAQGFRFEIELRRGAGAYICGEETALLNSIEGYRGEPRNKPPFPVQVGLFGKPTVVNNVETLVNVLEIIRHGGTTFASIGTAASTGTKLFCVSGVRPGRELQAILLGGAAGTFLTPAQLDTPLTFEGTRAIGATIGSGAVMVFDDTIDMKAVLSRIAAFFRDESCGQCVPCRIGTVRQEELLHRLIGGHTLGSLPNELALRAEIAQVMRDASICGLGQTAPSAIESAITQLHYFTPEEAS